MKSLMYKAMMAAALLAGSTLAGEAPSKKDQAEQFRQMQPILNTVRLKLQRSGWQLSDEALAVKRQLERRLAQRELLDEDLREALAQLKLAESDHEQLSKQAEVLRMQPLRSEDLKELEQALAQSRARVEERKEEVRKLQSHRAGLVGSITELTATYMRIVTSGPKGQGNTPNEMKTRVPWDAILDVPAPPEKLPGPKQ